MKQLLSVFLLCAAMYIPLANANTSASPLLATMKELQAEATVIEEQISKAQAESSEYEGGLIKNTIEQRIAVLKLTKSLVDQRIVAIRTGAKMKTQAPASAPDSEVAASAASEIESLDKRIEKTRADADQYNGGLIKATLESTVATMQSTRAMVDQRRLTAKFGLGLAQAPAGEGASAKSSPSSSSSSAKPKGEKKPAPNEQIIVVTLEDKRFSKKKYGHGIYFNLAFTAVGLEKPARAIKGSLVLNDLFGEKIMSIGWPLDDPMSPGETRKERDTGFDYNQFKDEHQRIRDAKTENLTATYRVDSIIYEDGTRIDF